MTKNCNNDYKMKFPMEEEFPDLSQHNNHMSKVLNKDIYTKLRSKSTPSGFTLDDCIQTGVDNPGKYNQTIRKWVFHCDITIVNMLKASSQFMMCFLSRPPLYHDRWLCCW